MNEMKKKNKNDTNAFDSHFIAAFIANNNNKSGNSYLVNI